MISRRHCGVGILACLALAAPLLTGHDLYLLPSSFFVSSGERIVVSINNGDSFPISEVAPQINRLQDTDLITPTAIYNMTSLGVNGKTVQGDVNIKSKGTLILTARTIPAYIDQEPEKFRDYLKQEGLTEILSQQQPGQSARERYSKYAKALIQSEASDEFFSHVVGFMIEIVPEKNPFTLHAGEELPILVLVRGKPAADLQIEAARAQTGPAEVKVIGRTDATGHATIPITGPGKWRLHTISMHKCSDPTLGQCWESFWASLTFEIR
ncbi:MAG: DUF4198 domain-containing protein [Acidobacteriota bacterium]|nr:DUF4198 domain-containing protein [Acidobacteriota bacterium]